MPHVREAADQFARSLDARHVHHLQTASGNVTATAQLAHLGSHDAVGRIPASGLISRFTLGQIRGYGAVRAGHLPDPTIGATLSAHIAASSTIWLGSPSTSLQREMVCSIRPQCVPIRASTLRSIA